MPFKGFPAICARGHAPLRCCYGSHAVAGILHPIDTIIAATVTKQIQYNCAAMSGFGDGQRDWHHFPGLTSLKFYHQEEGANLGFAM